MDRDSEVSERATVRPWTPLRQRRFLVYVVAVTTSSAGTYAATVALSFAVLEVAGPGSLGLILLAREVPLVALVLVGGVVADRFSRRTVLCASALVQATSQVAAAVVLGTSGGDTAALVVCAAVNGSASAFSRPATSGIVPELVPADQLRQANAALGFAPRLIGIAGAATGALLVGAVGAAWALAFDALTFVVAAAMYVLMGRTGRPPRPERVHVLRDLSVGWQAVRSQTWVWSMILSFAVFQLAYFPAIAVLGPEIARTDYGGASAWATVLSAGLVGGVVGVLIVAQVAVKRSLVVVCLAATFNVVELWALAGGLSLVLVAALAFVGGIGITLGDVLWATTLQRRIDPDKLSRVASFDWLGSLALNPIGYALVAPIAVVLGAHTTLALAGVLLGLGALLPLLSHEVRSTVLTTAKADAPQ